MIYTLRVDMNFVQGNNLNYGDQTCGADATNLKPEPKSLTCSQPNLTPEQVTAASNDVDDPLSLFSIHTEDRSEFRAGKQSHSW